jgi:uncharacterized membrane protein
VNFPADSDNESPPQYFGNFQLQKSTTMSTLRRVVAVVTMMGLFQLTSAVSESLHAAEVNSLSKVQYTFSAIAIFLKSHLLQHVLPIFCTGCGSIILVCIRVFDFDDFRL